MSRNSSESERKYTPVYVPGPGCEDAAELAGFGVSVFLRFFFLAISGTLAGRTVEPTYAGRPIQVRRQKGFLGRKSKTS